MLVYKGNCQSISKHGVKFTRQKNNAIVTDEVAKKFEVYDDFIMSDIKKQDVVPPKNNENDSSKEVESNPKKENESKESEIDIEDIKKKLMKLKVEQLVIMCENKGLQKGTKSQMIESLLQAEV